MIEGFRVGHYTDEQNVTGCTVVLAPPEGAVAGVDVRGFAPGTIGTDTLSTGRLVERAHAIVLSGGSAFGLDTVAGVVKYLEAQGVGLDVGVARVPIVAGAILFDLSIGNPDVRPRAEDAFAACEQAREIHFGADGLQDELAQGSVGAGTGATIGKVLGIANATKGGIGCAQIVLGDGVTVAAIVAVNAVGDVLDSTTAQILGGARRPQRGWLDSSAFLLGERSVPQPPLANLAGQNTTIGVILTDAALGVEQANILATMAHDGIARATSPSHTLMDGDTLFVLGTGTKGPQDLTMLGHAAAVCVARAIAEGVRHAKGLGSVKAWNE